MNETTTKDSKTRRWLGRAHLQVRRHGWSAALHDLAIRALNSVSVFKILRGVVIERPDPAYLSCPDGYAAGFLTAPAVRALARLPELEMADEFVEEALAKGDRCFALWHGATLAAYGWYSSAPTRIDPPDLQLRFGDRYVYMYKGFTHPSHRGKRLHAVGMTMALRHFVESGSLGMVSYVESNNFDSLKSVHRMGYTRFGSVYVVKLGGRWLTSPTRGCRAFGFEIEPRFPAPGHASVRLAS